jgi:thiol-disulfide isomerase/thioredoxin
MLRLIAATLSTLTLLATSAHAQTLRIGSQAPKMEHVDWLKGEPIKEWKPGHVYVLDFWATWCAPCIAGIPHLTAMQKELRDQNVHVIGVAIWPMPDQKPTTQFVKEWGDDMGYAVAEDRDQKTADAFMAAARLNSIPTAMVIDQQGRIAWIGHPMAGLDDVVAQILEGSYDIDSLAKEAAARAELEARVEPLLKEIDRLASEGNIREALDKVDEVIAMGYDPVRLALTKANAMIAMLSDVDGAYAFLTKCIDGYFKDDSDALNDVAWYILDASGLPRRDLALAHRAVTRANELTGGNDASVVDTLARSHFMQGDVDRAIELQKRAIELADNEMKALFETHMLEYRTAKDRGE